MLIDAVQSVGRFVKITAVKVHDKTFWKVWNWYRTVWLCLTVHIIITSSLHYGLKSKCIYPN